MKKQSNLKKELEHLFKTRKNNMKVCIYQNYDYGFEYWVYLDEFKREDVQNELKELNILDKEIKNKKEYTKSNQRIISLQID